MDRRAFLKTGLLTGSILVTGTSLYGCSDLDILDTILIDDDVSVALAAIIPVFLAPMLPTEETQRQQRIARTVEGVGLALKKLPPHTLDELTDLFGLLTNRLVALSYAGNFSLLSELSMSQRVSYIEGLRTSYIGLINTAYEGLKELVFAAFYGNPDNWATLNYNKPNLGV
jgi:hypothetical protein